MDELNEFPGIIQQMVDQEMERYHAALEKACEQALQTGTHGVLVERRLVEPYWTITVTTEVPYGMIHERDVR
jgi:hypothetical protein